MNVAGRVLVAVMLASMSVAQTDMWQTHRDLAAKAVKEKNYDVAEREGGAAYLESLKPPGDEKRIALTLMDWARAYEAARKYRDAEALYRKALGLYQRAPADPAGAARARQRLTGALGRQGSVNYNRPLEKPLAKLREALGVMASAPDTAPRTAASLLNRLGVGLSYDGYYVAAQKILMHSINLSESPVTLTNLGEAERRTGLYSAAEEHLKRAVTLEAASDAASTEETESSIAQQRLYRLGLLYHDQGQYEVAEVVLKQALAAGRNTSWRADIHRAIGSGYRERGKHVEADAFYQRALDLEKEVYPSRDSRFRAECLDDMGLSAFKQRDFGKAETLWREARRMFEGLLRPEHPAIGMVLWHQALLLNEQRKPLEAAQLIARALAIMEPGVGPGAPILVALLKDCAAIHAAAGDPAAAQAARARAAAILPTPPVPSRKTTTSRSVPLEIELAYWASIQGRKEKSLYHAYQRAFPSGRFSEEAVRIAGREPLPAVPADPPCAREFDAVPIDRFSTCFGAWSKAGFAPAALAVYQENGATLVAGSFQRLPARLTTMLSESEQQQAMDLYTARNYRADIISVLHTKDGPRFTTTWVPAEGGFAMAVYPSADLLNADLARHNTKKLANISVIGIDPNGGRYIAAWAEMPAWTEVKSFFDLTSTGAGDVHNTQTAAGLIPYRTWWYPTRGGNRAAEIWVRGPSVYWYTYPRMNKRSFDARRAELEARGFSLVHIDVLGEQFSAIWWRTD